jgi:hypothetical protein
LPFSAAFASTLVLSRMSADNEVQACRAAGLSYGTILLPVVFLGLSLTLGMYYMSNWVVPNFYRSAEGMIQKNLVQMMLTQVQKREPVEIPNTRMVVYANNAYEVTPKYNPNWAHQPDRLLVFEGVAAGRIDEGQLRNEVTAEKAEVLIYRIEGQTWIQMRLTNVLAVDQGHLVQAASAPMAPIRVPNPMKDRARFLSWPELRQIMREPEQFDEINELKQSLAQGMARESLTRQILALLTAGKPVTLKGVGPNESYTITSPRFERHGQSVLLMGDKDHPVLIEQFDQGKVNSRFQCAQAKLSVDPGQDAQSEPNLDLTMTNVTAANVRQNDPGSVQRSLARNELRWPEPIMDQMDQHSAMDLMAAAAEHDVDSPLVMGARHELVKEIDKLWRRLISQVHQRAASAVSCLLVLLLGGVLSIKLCDRLPLVVYFWTFLLAFIAVVIINSGDNLADSSSKHSLLMALSTIWAGNVILLVALGLNYWKLSRT